MRKEHGMGSLAEIVEEGIGEICGSLAAGIEQEGNDSFLFWDPRMEETFNHLSTRYGAILPPLNLAAASYYLGFIVLCFSKVQESRADALLEEEHGAPLFQFFADFFAKHDREALNFNGSAYDSTKEFLQAWLDEDAPFSARRAKSNFFLDLCIRFDQLHNTKLSSRLLNDIRYLVFTLVMADEKVSSQEQELIDFLEKESARIRESIGDDQEYDIHARDNAALLEEAKAELEELIGLDSIKREIVRLESFLRIQKIREEKKLAVASLTLHFVFRGNPGTGKTTVARIIGKIFKGVGFLKKGQLVETDRSGLVAEYLGQTASKTKTVVESALDGILFVDEAYALSRGGNGGSDNFGREAIETLLKLMEDNRNRLVVVVAGYPQLMEDFINTNPGLKSRFTRYLTFEDFTPDELLRILRLFAGKGDYAFSPDAEEELKTVISKAYETKEDGFGNARYVRNLFQEMIQNQALRLSAMDEPLDTELLKTIECVDLPDRNESGE